MEVNLEMGEEKGPFPQKVGLIRRKNQADDSRVGRVEGGPWMESWKMKARMLV